MSGGGTESEGEWAAARLRMRLEQGMTPREIDRLRREEGREIFDGRLLALAVVGAVYVLLDLFF
jgi:hypothetical protein